MEARELRQRRALGGTQGAIDMPVTTIKEMPKQNYQMNIFEASNPKLEKIQEALKKLDVNTLSPIEALLKLNEFKKMLE